MIGGFSGTISVMSGFSGRESNGMLNTRRTGGNRGKSGKSGKRKKGGKGRKGGFNGRMGMM